MKKLIQCFFGLGIALNTSVAYGFSTISGRSQIVPSTNIPTLNLPNIGAFTIDQIADGITTNSYFQGFASSANQGTITLDLVSDFDLRSFILWNDVNVQQEGIKDFRLDFFNSSNTLIPVNFSTTFVAPIGQVAAKEYLFDEIVTGVSRVDLVVLSSNPGFNRIEIREVAFTGTPTNTPTNAAVPEPTSILGIAVAGFGMLFARQGRTSQSK